MRRLMTRLWPTFCHNTGDIPVERTPSSKTKFEKESRKSSPNSQLVKVDDEKHKCKVLTEKSFEIIQFSERQKCILR